MLRLGSVAAPSTLNPNARCSAYGPKHFENFYVHQPKHVVHVSNKNNRGYSIGSTTIDRKKRNLRPKKMVDYLDPIVFKAKRKDIHTYKKYMLENVELCLKYK
jgi:23S rRNA maturation-related 3'-5' exoribonuclease YhaM